MEMAMAVMDTEAGMQLDIVAATMAMGTVAKARMVTAMATGTVAATAKATAVAILEAGILVLVLAGVLLVAALVLALTLPLLATVAVLRHLVRGDRSEDQ